MSSRPRASFRAVDAVTLPDALAAELVRIAVPGTALRVAVDGPRAADPGGFAESLVGPLRALGHPAVCIRAETFWRSAALRLEHGRTDLASFATNWLDAEALTREVLDPVGVGGHGRFIPSLRDPVSDRATREPARASEPGLILLVSGELLLGRGLAFDYAIHLALSPAARRRRTPDEWQWTLPAFDDYERAVDPVRLSDVAIRYDDPDRPARRVNPSRI